MMFYTDYILEIEMQTYMGWYMISSIVANGVVNILIVMWFGGKSIVLVVIKYYRRAKNKIQQWRDKYKAENPSIESSSSESEGLKSIEIGPL